MKVQLLIRRYNHMIGLARYATALQKALSNIGVEYTCIEPSHPLPLRLGARLLRPFGYDVNTFFSNYPVAARLEKGVVTHLTAQIMASLLSFKPDLRKVVITVHDIVPYLVRNNTQQSTFSHSFDRFFDQMAMNNLRKADLLITVSTHTKEMLVSHLSCAPEKIRVILEGIDHTLFRPVPVTAEFYTHYNLQPECKYLLHVGSENPRKNLIFLLQALAELRKRVPNVKLLRVGSPENQVQHELFRKQITALRLEEQVALLGHIPQQDLTKLFCAVDGFVFPSLYEGFGLPPLEAMACGTPVVCSTAASLPEVVGEAALSVDPQNIQGWVDAMERILLDQPLRQELKERGLIHAREFTWERTARQTLAVYQELE